MTRTLSSLFLIFALSAGAAHAQEPGPAPGSIEIAVTPGGGTFFLKGKDTGEPAFGNYDFGWGVTVNLNRYVGVEGEVGGSLGMSQRIELPASPRDLTSPNMLQYSGNLVVSAPNRTSVVPFITGGVGGLSIFDTTALAITENKTFLTGNVGAGLKWYAGRWGLRGDYRLIAVRSQDDAPAFFGRETRYGHRVSASLLLNIP